KIAIEDFFMIPRDWLHVPIGLALFAGLAAVLSRVRGGVAIAWLGTLLLELLNEGIDASYATSPDLAEAGKDIVSTMAAPTLLLVVVTVRAGRARRAAGRA